MRKSIESGGALAAIVTAAVVTAVAVTVIAVLPIGAAVAAQPRVISTAAVPAMPPLVRTGAMTPQAIELRPMTPAETQANAIWSLRAGLNVAALQCQFSSYLATVSLYNDLLKHHSAELVAAQTTMIAHFKRYDKTRALNSFDQYSTRIYNSYSTLDAQFSFCTAASSAGREALLLQKRGLGTYALAATPVLRTALTPAAKASLPVLEVIPPIVE